MIRKTLSYSKHPRKRLVLFLLSLSLTWGIGQIGVNQIDSWGLSPVNAQTLRPEQAAGWQRLTPRPAATPVYEQLPYLPQENQYISVETGKVDPEHTLINRFIRYHKDIKRRSPIFSLDWKVTLADYLGINRSIRASNYPGDSTLTSNPLDNDLKAIRQLNRRQRQELVDLLVKLYKPKTQQSSKTPQLEDTEETPDASTPSNPSLSSPGDAQLLMP